MSWQNKKFGDLKCGEKFYYSSYLNGDTSNKDGYHIKVSQLYYFNAENDS